jgi:hypothetical protein
MIFVINATFFAQPPQQANKSIFSSEWLGKYFMLHNWQAGTASVVIDSSCFRFPAEHFCKNYTCTSSYFLQTQTIKSHRHCHTSDCSCQDPAGLQLHPMCGSSFIATYDEKREVREGSELKDFIGT